MFSRHDWDGSPQRDQVYGPRFTARSTLLRRMLGRVRPRSVLDIGCGSGTITRHVADYSGHVHAIDVSPKAIEVAQENLAGSRKVTFESIDVFGCSEEARSHLAEKHDVIVLSEVLEHLDDDETALRIVRSLLPPGGYLVLTVPGDPHQWSIDDDLSGHKRRYTKPELILKLTRAGFRVERITNWGFPFTRLLVSVERRLMASQQGQNALPMMLRTLLRPVSLLFRLNGIIEPLFSFVDAGIGYVVLAKASESTRHSAEKPRPASKVA